MKTETITYIPLGARVQVNTARYGKATNWEAGIINGIEFKDYAYCDFKDTEKLNRSIGKPAYDVQLFRRNGKGQLMRKCVGEENVRAI